METESEKEYSDIILMRNIAIDYKEGRFLAEWLENAQFYLGNQWDFRKLKNLASWRSASVSNVIMRGVEQVHSLMTDDQTQAFVKRVAGGSYSVERILDNIVKQVWDKQKIQAEISKLEKDRLYFGTGFMKVWHDDRQECFLNVHVKRISPFDFYIDPLAVEIDKARYIFERERVSKAELLDRYPEHWDEIVNSSYNSGDPRGDEGAKKRGSDEVPDALYIWHCYIKDLTFFEFEEGEQQEKKRKRKYKNGRYICLLGDVALVDQPHKTKGWPYVACPLIEIPDELFGLSLITPMKFPQEEINFTKSNIFDNLKSNTNPIWVATEGVIDIDEFVPTPNSVITLRNKNEDMFEKINGIQLPGEVFHMYENSKKEVLESAGLSDVTFGAGAQSSRPGTVRANFNASITRIRQYIRLTHACIEEVGNKIIRLVQAHTPMNTMIEVSEKDDAPLDFVDSDNIKKILAGLQQPQILKNLDVVNIVLNQVNDEFEQQLNALIEQGGAEEVLPHDELRQIVQGMGILEFKNDVRTGEYNYSVKSHPIQIQDPNNFMEVIQVLLQYGVANAETGTPGIIDFEWVLEMLPLPNKKSLIERQKRKQKMLEQQMMAQQQQNGGQQNG